MTAPASSSSAPTWPADLRHLQLGFGDQTLHLRVAGSGPAILLLHGTGTSGDSFSPLVRLLSPHATCLVPDLPGHGASSLPPDLADLGIRGMAAVVASALERLGVAPSLVVGHSAGFVVGVQLALDARVAVPLLAGVGPALWLSQNPRRSPLWPAVAAISRAPLLASLLSRAFGSAATVSRLARSTGSELPAEQLAAYTALAKSPRHLHAMLSMMAAWDLDPVQRAASRIAVPVLLLAGERDPWFPPSNVASQASYFPRGSSVTLAGLGHFLHEERPDLVAAHLLQLLATPT